MTPIDLELEFSLISSIAILLPSSSVNSTISSTSTTSSASTITKPNTTHSSVSTTTTATETATIFWTTCNALIMICILAGNSLTILAIITCRRLRSLTSNIFILSLAISDFAVGITLPYHIAFYLGSNLGKSQNLCLLRFFIIIFTCCVSILTLIAIAVDRYIAILHALHYRRCMTRRVSLIIITFNWTMGACVALIPVFINHYSTAIECEFYEVLPTWYMAGVTTPGFVLIWLVMLFIYWHIMREAAKQSKQSHCNRDTQSKSSKKQRTLMMPDWKSMQIVIIIMGCFSVCWLTYFVVVLMEILNIYNKSKCLYKIAFSLAVSNSAMNPLIYCWKNTTFRRAYWRLLRCKNPNYQNPNKIDFMAHCSANSMGNLPHNSRNSAITISVIPLEVVVPLKANHMLMKVDKVNE